MSADVDRLRDLLHRWEQHWRAAGAPIASLLRPGASEDHIDEVTATLGIHLPAEAKVLFTWHDGVTEAAWATSTTPPADPSVGARFTLMSIERAAAKTLEHREYALEAYKDIAGDEELEAAIPLWKPSYFAILGGVINSTDTVCVDTATPSGGDALVGLITGEGMKPPRPGRSLTDLVAFWVECLDSGTYTWDRQASRWRAPMFVPPFAQAWHSYYG